MIGQIRCEKKLKPQSKLLQPRLPIARSYVDETRLQGDIRYKHLELGHGAAASRTVICPYATASPEFVVRFCLFHCSVTGVPCS